MPAQVTIPAIVLQRCDRFWHPTSPSLQACRGDRKQRNGGRAGDTHRRGASDRNFSGPAPGRGRRSAGANPQETDRSGFWGRKLLRAARPLPDFLEESVPLRAGTGPPPPERRSEAQPRGAPLGQGRCRADPPPARLSVWARGEGREGGHRHRGGRTTRACPPALPARRNAGRLLLVEELGQAGRRRRHPSAGGPAAGIALRRVSAAGSRGLAHGSGGDHTGRPLRREARVAAQPSAVAAGGRVAERREGAEDRPWRQPRSPRRPPAGLATAGQATPCD